MPKTLNLTELVDHKEYISTHVEYPLMQNGEKIWCLVPRDLLKNVSRYTLFPCFLITDKKVYDTPIMLSKVELELP